MCSARNASTRAIESAGQEMTREWLARRLARADALMARLWPPEPSD